MNTPKSKTQQQIEAIRRRLAAGEISHADAAAQVARVRSEHYQRLYWSLLDDAAWLPVPDQSPVQFRLGSASQAALLHPWTRCATRSPSPIFPRLTMTVTDRCACT